jgi:hypothetical protein
MTAAVAAPAAKATPAEVADLLLLADLMGDLEQVIDLVEKHENRPCAEHLRRIMAAYADAVEFLGGTLPLPDDEAEVAP